MPELVEIGSANYDVYADLSTADLYLDAALHADNWRAADVDSQARALVTATRVLDRQRWKGEKVVADQPLSFPRTDMAITPEPLLRAADDIPLDIINASIELALALVDGLEVQNNQTTNERIRSMSAGSVSISFSRTVAGEVSLRFPLIIHELIRRYLAGGDSSFMAKATGVDAESIFPLDLGLLSGSR